VDDQQLESSDGCGYYLRTTLEPVVRSLQRSVGHGMPSGRYLKCCLGIVASARRRWGRLVWMSLVRGTILEPVPTNSQASDLETRGSPRI
jgi:hypothetical protein